MHTNRPSVLPLLLVAALLAVSVPAAVSVPVDATVDDPTGTTRTVTSVRNTTAYLMVDRQAIESEEYAEVGISVAGAVAVDAERLHGRYQSLTFQNAFAATDDPDQRVRLLQREADRIETRIRSLQRRQRQILRQYNTERLSTHRFLEELATIDAAASRLRADLRTVRRQASVAAGFSFPNDLQTRFDNLESELVALEGPVRDQLASSLTGNTTVSTAYVVTTDDAIVLATTTGERYVREAYLGSERVAGGVDRFGESDRPRISVAYQRAADLYPWAFEHALAPPSANGFGNTSVYRIDIDHTHGSLTTYLDGSTRNAYREIQHKRLAGVPTTTQRNRTETVTLLVNRTHPTGPMQVTVVRRNTTVPVAATIRVNGQPVGETGLDGTLWTVTPTGFVRVNATTAAGEQVTVRFAN